MTPDEILVKAANSSLSDDAFRVINAALQGEEQLNEVLAELRQRSDELDEAGEG